jgi:hypothetical protein
MGDKHKLAEALNFTEADLDANREGRMTPTQEKRLMNRKLFSPGSWQFQLLVGGGIIGLLVSLLVLVSVLRIGMRPISLILLLLMIAIYAAMGWFYGKVRRQVRVDKKAGVESITGLVGFEIQEGNPSNYFVKTQGLRFEVSQAGMLAFYNGRPYHLYYTPNTNLLLSAEPVMDEDDVFGTANDIDVILDDYKQQGKGTK